MPRRLITAWWMMAYGGAMVLSWVAVSGVVATGLVELPELDFSELPEGTLRIVVLTMISTVVSAVALIVGGRWVRAGLVKGHYLALIACAVLALSAVTRQVVVTSDFVRMWLMIGFIALILTDLYRLRTKPDFSLTVENYRLADFWPIPWLMSASFVALFGIAGTGLATIALHLLSPLALVFIHVKLRRHPQVARGSGKPWYGLSLVLWGVAYVLSLGLGWMVLMGLAGLTMQGGGQ